MHKTYLLNGPMKPFNRKPKDLKRDSKGFSDLIISHQNCDTSIYFEASFNFLNTCYEVTFVKTKLLSYSKNIQF